MAVTPPPLKFFPKFLSLHSSTYLLPRYWPSSSLLNQSEGALGKLGKTDTSHSVIEYLQHICPFP